MGMNPQTNRFEELQQLVDEANGKTRLVRPNGDPFPQHWATFRIGEEVVIKGYTFKVAYFSESNIVLEPVRAADLAQRLGDPVDSVG